jgi:hypothetical protein
MPCFSIFRRRFAWRSSRLALVAVLPVALLLSSCDPMDSAELRREVDAIGSVAAEGELLASDVSLDRTKATFVRVHAGELASAADDSAQKLNDADLASGLEDDARRAIRIAMDASDALGELEISPGDERQAKTVEAKLASAGNRADELSSSL